MFKKVAIIGVGLIGGSIGKAIRRKRLAKEVWGLSRHIDSIKNAKRAGAIDYIARDIKEAVAGADLIIVAAPPSKVVDLIKEASMFAKAGAIFTDVASTKAVIVSATEKILPSNIYFVGSHPMAGSHLSGVKFADADLFKASVCFVTKTKMTRPKALNKILRLWASLGAKVYVIGPAEHDKAVASISHLPHAISFALVNSADKAALRFAAGGFKAMTRIAKSDPHMWTDIMISNDREIIKGIDSFVAYMNKLKGYIKNKRCPAILKEFKKSKLLRELILDNNDNCD